MPDRLYTIGEAARMGGTTVKTVRHYSEIGLLPPSEITESGYRLYSPDDIWRLQMILTLRSVGFSLKDIHRILEGEWSFHQAVHFQMEAIDNQIRHLRRTREILSRAAESTDAGQALHHLIQLADAAKKEAAERKALIESKLSGIGMLQNMHPEWKELFLQNFTKCLPASSPLSPEQEQAWQEMVGLLEEPSFQKPLRELAGFFISASRHGTWHIEEILREVGDVLDQAKSFVIRGADPACPEVQELVDRWLEVHARAVGKKADQEFSRQIHDLQKKIFMEEYQGKNLGALMLRVHSGDRIKFETWTLLYRALEKKIGLSGTKE